MEHSTEIEKKFDIFTVDENDESSYAIMAHDLEDYHFKEILMSRWTAARAWLTTVFTTQETEIERDLQAIFDKLGSIEQGPEGPSA